MTLLPPITVGPVTLLLTQELRRCCQLMEYLRSHAYVTYRPRSLASLGNRRPQLHVSLVCSLTAFSFLFPTSVLQVVVYQLCCSLTAQTYIFKQPVSCRLHGKTVRLHQWAVSGRGQRLSRKWTFGHVTAGLCCCETWAGFRDKEETRNKVCTASLISLTLTNCPTAVWYTQLAERKCQLSNCYWWLAHGSLKLCLKVLFFSFLKTWLHPLSESKALFFCCASRALAKISPHYFSWA